MNQFIFTDRQFDERTRLRHQCGRNGPIYRAREEFISASIIGAPTLPNPYDYGTLEREAYARAVYDEQSALCDAVRALQLNGAGL